MIFRKFASYSFNKTTFFSNCETKMLVAPLHFATYSWQRWNRNLSSAAPWMHGFIGCIRAITMHFNIDKRPFPFYRLFTCEGDIEYTGWGSTKRRGLKDRELPWLPSLLRFDWGKVLGSMFCTVMEAYKDLPIIRPRVWARMFSCKLLSTAAAFVPLHFVALKVLSSEMDLA